nr:S8 family serine peptidase [uncultured Methanospirillum sp.]
MKQILKILSLLLCITMIMGCFADIGSSSQFTANNSSSVSAMANASYNIQSANSIHYRQTANQISPSNQTQLVSKSPTLNRSYVPDRVLVQYKTDTISAMGGVSQVSATLNADIQATILADESTLGLSGIQLVKIPNDTTVDAAIQYYTNNSNVAYAQPDYIYQACNETNAAAVTSVADNFSNYRNKSRESGFVSSNYSSPPVPSGVMRAAQGNNTTTLSWPNDPYYSYQWDMVKMACPSAWAVSTGSSSVTVAVVDTGVDYTHPDLAANCISGYDFVNNDADPMDDNGHGTHCAGSIAAIGNNGAGIAGVTWNSKIMPLKFLNSGGYGYTSDALSAFAWGYARGVRIFSNSWGGYGTDTALQSAINSYSDAIFLCAAGNDGVNIDSYTFSPAGLSCANIVSVAMTDSSDNLVSWSNYGPTTVDVAAPGLSIYSCKPGSSYQYMSGTSMATPHVAGLAALMKSVAPLYNITQLKKAFIKGVDIKDSLYNKCVSGGRANLYNTLTEYPNIYWLKNSALNSLLNNVNWGNIGSTPLSGLNFSENTNDDLILFNGYWQFNNNNDSTTDKQISWGSKSDIPLLGDYNGDGVSDICLFRPSTGTWFFDYSADSVTDKKFSWGSSGDSPLSGDFNGDGISDICLFRPSTGMWFFDYSADSVTDKKFLWGSSGDSPLSGDFNGDEISDICLYRPSTGMWFFDYSADSVTDKKFLWGHSSDIPYIGDFNGDNISDIGLYSTSANIIYIDNNIDAITDLKISIKDNIMNLVTGDINSDNKDDIIPVCLS